MFNLSGSELVFLLLLALIVLGPEKLPDAIRRFGRTYAELKKMGNGFQTELKSALDEPMREVRSTADALRKAASIDGIDGLVNDAKSVAKQAAGEPVATPSAPASPAPETQSESEPSAPADEGAAPA